MRLFMKVAFAVVAAAFFSTAALAESCSDRASLCQAACTPALVASGEQHGGTVKGCQSSCQSRLRSCLRSGIWVHMGSRTRGMQQKVDKR